MNRTLRTRTGLSALLCLSALAACASAPAGTPGGPAPPPEARVALGDETAAILQGATHVQVFRLLTETRRDQLELVAQFQGRTSDPVSQGQFSDDRTIDRSAPDQGRAFVARMDRLLFDDELYDTSGLAKCFDPGVGLRLWKGRERVDIALCFECGQLSVTTFNAAGRRIHVIPQLAMGLDQPLFVRLIQPVFPRDMEIQAVRAYDLPADVATPEARAAQEDDIRAAAFRHLLTEPAVAGAGAQTYYLSTGPARLISADPSAALLRRFDGHTPPVEAVSRRPQPRAGVTLRVSHLQWVVPVGVFVDAGYDRGDGKHGSFTYGLRKAQGGWVVFQDDAQTAP